MPSHPEAGLPDNLERNLRALMVQARGLVKRLLMPGAKDHLRGGNEAELHCRLGSEWLALVHGSQELEGRLLEIEGSRSVLVFGVGSGDGLARLIAAMPQTEVYAWDRDPHLLRATLERHDFEEALTAGRLRFGLGVDLLVELERSSIGDIVEHPMLAAIYSEERNILHNGRCGGPRVLLDTGDEDASALAAALREAECEVWPLDVRRLSAEELDFYLDQYEPDQVLTLRWREHLAPACAKRGIDLTLWELEVGPERILGRVRGRTELPVFSSCRSRVAEYEESGFEQARVLERAIAPPAARPTARLEETLPDSSAPLCFTGSSLVEGAIAGRRNFVELYTSWRQGGAQAAEECDRLLQSVLDEQRANYGEYLVPQLLPQYFGEFLAAAERSEVPEDLVRQIGAIAAAEKRLGYVADLGSLGIEVWGDEHWLQAEAYGVEYRGEISDGEQRLLIQGSAAIHVDVPVLSAEGRLTPTLLRTLAAGGFLITEHSPAVAEAFEIGGELITYRDQVELHEHIEFYMEHPAEARAIAARGRARVLADHTWSARLPELWKAWNARVPS